MRSLRYLLGLQDPAPAYVPPTPPPAPPMGAFSLADGTVLTTPEPEPRWSPQDDRDLDALLAESAPPPTKRLTEAQVAALVEEGAYRASVQTAIATLARARAALAGNPEAQAVLSALLDEVDGD